MENLLVVNSQNNSLYGTFFCYFYIIWIFLRHICTIFFYLYFKWIILFFSCIINLSQSDTVMKIRTIFSIFTGPCTNYFLEMRDSGMEKRQRYQGFRKFSIRTRLIIALFLISIVPLTGISFYSFHIFQKRFGKTSTSISQTLSMINLNMVSEN